MFLCNLFNTTAEWAQAKESAKLLSQTAALTKRSEPPKDKSKK